jgi:hypothetical protein
MPAKIQECVYVLRRARKHCPQEDHYQMRQTGTARRYNGFPNRAKTHVRIASWPTEPVLKEDVLIGLCTGIISEGVMVHNKHRAPWPRPYYFQ